MFRATPGVRRGGRNCSHGPRTARTGQFGIVAVKFGRECKFRIFHKRWIIYTAKVGKAGLAPRVSLVINVLIILQHKIFSESLRWLRYVRFYYPTR